MANVPTTSWSESSPAGSDNINAGDNRIREMKTQIREVIDVDHDFPSSGQASDNGQHKRVTLQEQADLGTGAVGTTILGSQTIDGKGELVYTDEDDNDIQITKDGSINVAALAGTLPSAILGQIYPVGCVYTNITGTNPNTELGFGTWTAFGAGRVLVGYDASDADFDTVEETGGAKTVTLDETMIPSHTHTESYNDNADGGTTAPASAGAGSATQFTSDATGGGLAHDNVQPYIVVHFWKRTV